MASAGRAANSRTAIATATAETGSAMQVNASSVRTVAVEVKQAKPLRLQQRGSARSMRHGHQPRQPKRRSQPQQEPWGTKHATCSRARNPLLCLNPACAAYLLPLRSRSQNLFPRNLR